MKSLLFPAALLLATAAVSNASVSVTANGDLSSSISPVGNGFNGAHFTFEAIFPDQNYVADDPSSSSPYPVAVADVTSLKLTITGAADPNLNGTFSHNAGSTNAIFYPTYAGIYAAPNNSFDSGELYFNLGGGRLVGMGLFLPITSSGSQAAIGSPMSIDDFGSGALLPPANNRDTLFETFFGGNSSELTVSHGTVSIATVPEPASAALMLFGCIGLVSRRRR
jgi:hypothetical protein